MSSEEFNYFIEWRNVVLTADAHNPTLLNPDFLIRNKIIPEEWNITETFTTPPFSVVTFENITISMQQNRLEVRETINNFSAQNDTPIYNIAKNIVMLLKFVNYKSMGLNWNIYYPIEQESDSWVINKFLNSEIKDKSLDALSSCQITLRYDTTDSRLNLTLSPKEIDFDKLKGECINLNTNFSYSIPEEEISKDNGVTFIEEKIDVWREKEERTTEYIENLFAG
jgi:hypothetical protein